MARSEHVLLSWNTIRVQCCHMPPFVCAKLIKSKWCIFVFDWPRCVDIWFRGILKWCVSAGSILNKPDSIPVRSQREMKKSQHSCYWQEELRLDSRKCQDCQGTNTLLCAWELWTLWESVPVSREAAVSNSSSTSIVCSYSLWLSLFCLCCFCHSEVLKPVKLTRVDMNLIRVASFIN